MTDETTLEPCPFCGGEAQYSEESRFHICWVYCSGCGAASGYRNTEAEAIAAWNKRHVKTCHAESDLSEWVCSNCQCWIPLGLTQENIKYASEWRFCPNCGAKVVDE